MFGQSTAYRPARRDGSSGLDNAWREVKTPLTKRGSLAALMGNRTVITELRSIHKRLTEYKRIKPDENFTKRARVNPAFGRLSFAFGCAATRPLRYII